MIDFSNIKLPNFKIINTHNDSIYSLLIFLLGNFLTTSSDRSIKICDKNYK